MPSSETRAPRPRPVDATPARRTELVDSIAEAVAESLRDVITARATENLAATLRDTITAQLQARDTSSNDSTSDTTDASSAISFDTLSDSDSEISDDESTAAPRCTANHVARRPIDRHCVICRERMSRRRLDELVWCKSECGKSFHKDCFERWRENSSQIDSVGTLRCVIWYVADCNPFVQDLVLADLFIVVQYGLVLASMITRSLECNVFSIVRKWMLLVVGC